MHVRGMGVVPVSQQTRTVTVAKSRMRAKGRREGGSFALVPHALLECANYASLSPRAVKLFLDLYGQYRGTNNGDFTLAWKVMQTKGWTSKDQLGKARRELLEKGFIVQTRQGWNNRCSLYGVTLHPIDECGGKLDIKPTTTALGWWKNGPPEKISRPVYSTDVSRVAGQRVTE